VLDFDGVFTDNKVIVFQDGREAVRCDRSDGWGLSQLKQTSLPILVLSTETNPVVRARCEKLGLPYLQGVADKGKALRSWLETAGLEPEQVVYVGNDDNDLDCMARVGCAVAVADAVAGVEAADIVLEHPGGAGDPESVS
jgi:N-acylneuraminate cytidylyltransferase